MGKILFPSSRELHDITVFLLGFRVLDVCAECTRQLDPMKQIVKELKKDRDSSMKKITGIEKDISGLIQKFKV